MTVPIGMSLPEQLARHAATQGSKLAVAVVGADPEVRRECTYAELDLDVDRALATFWAHGVRPGDRVIVLLSNEDGLSAVTAILATQRLGAVAVPVNPRLGRTELEQLLVEAEPRLVVARPDPHCAVTRSLGGQGQPPVLAPDGMLADAGLTVRLPTPTPWAVASWLFTSGTTGAPKRVRFSHQAGRFAGVWYAEALSLTAHDCIMSPVPIYTSSGMHLLLAGALASGATYVMQASASRVPGGTVHELVRLGVQHYAPTVYAGVPTSYADLLHGGGLATLSAGGLQRAGFGGAPMSRTILEGLRRQLPTVELVQTYGLTESGPSGLYVRSEELIDEPGTIGRVRGTGVLIGAVLIDEEGREIEEPGVPGELLLDTPAAGDIGDGMTTSGRWVRTGDLAKLTPEGLFVLVGRRKEMIIRGGMNIAPGEVENVLRGHTSVMDAAVAGVPDIRLGERIVAFVVPHATQSINPAALRTWCRDQLAHNKVPDEIVEVLRLPLTGMGKVDRHLLVGQYVHQDTDANKQGRAE